MNSEPIKDNTSSEVQLDPKPENWSKLSYVLHILFPIAGLFLLLRQKQIFSRLLLQIDRNCLSVFCPSFSQREKLLKWAGTRLPEMWSSQSRTLAGGVAELWSDGSLLCTLINSAIPGACPNPHRHWRKPPLHAQAIAYKYLGVIPIFTESDLKSSLTVSLERSFLRYLNELQQAIIKLSEKNDIPKSISMHYITRGMGLYTGEQHRKTVFYVYPNMIAKGQNSNIIVHIRGPYATYGKAIIPKFHNDLFTTPEICVTTELLTTKKLHNGNVAKPRNSFMKSFSLPFMQYHKKHMGDNIVIDVTMEDDRARVTYIPKNYGMYEIIMISNGELIRGCPFNVNILSNVSGIEDSFENEDKRDEVPNLRRRKVLSKTIDFIDEQMPVADVFKRYQIKEERLEIQRHLQLKEGIGKITEEEKKEKERNFSDLLKKHMETPNLTDEEELYSLESGINSDTDKSDLNLGDIPLKIPERILEKQNSESTNENYKLSKANGNGVIVDHILNGNYQTPRSTIHKVNYYADNTRTHKVVNNDISEGLQLKSASESANEGKTVADVLDRQQLTCNFVSKSTIPISSPHKTDVNKIKIPEKFCELQTIENNTFKDGLHSKYFKNAINNSNKREIPKSIPNEFHKDGNNYTIKKLSYLYDKDNYLNKKDYKNDNNNNNNNFTLNHNDEKLNLVLNQVNTEMDVKKLKVVPKRFLQHQKHPQNLEPSLDCPRNTSPICHDHIVPEVENEYSKLSVAEKRKIFAKQTSNRVSNSTTSSFSGSERTEDSSNRLNFKQFEGLSVLNYLGSLKKSESTKHHEVYPLCSTVSLPNISSMQFPNTVKERTNFWEKISSSTSSLSINSEAPFRRRPQKLTEIDRCRLIWKKPVETTTSNTSISTIGENIERNEEISKSVDDILSITKYIPYDIPKKYKSMDNSLDKCTMMSIEERKRLLLKQNYEKELPKKQSSQTFVSNSVKENFRKSKSKKQTLINEDEINVVFSSVLDRIKKYDSVCNLSNKIEEETSDRSTINNVTPTSVSENKCITVPANIDSNSNRHEDVQDSSQPEILTVKSHFKRAIKYFKNLEEKSLNKSNGNTSLRNCKMYYLDNTSNKYRNRYRKGGSLNLPNVSQRFRVDNLYEDVFGNRKGVFKGAANRSALVDALATFSRNESRSFKEDDDDITYEMFKKKIKTKKRKNVKSVFDIYY